jgi:hypothetical protein
MDLLWMEKGKCMVNEVSISSEGRGKKKEKSRRIHRKEKKEEGRSSAGLVPLGVIVAPFFFSIFQYPSLSSVQCKRTFPQSSIQICNIQDE